MGSMNNSFSKPLENEIHPDIFLHRYYKHDIPPKRICIDYIDPFYKHATILFFRSNLYFKDHKLQQHYQQKESIAELDSW